MYIEELQLYIYVFLPTPPSVLKIVSVQSRTQKITETWDFYYFVNQDFQEILKPMIYSRNLVLKLNIALNPPGSVNRMINIHAK